MITIFWRKTTKEEKKQIESALRLFFKADEYLKEIGYDTANAKFDYYTTRRRAGFGGKEPSFQCDGDDRLLLDEKTLTTMRGLIMALAPKIVVKPNKKENV